MERVFIVLKPLSINTLMEKNLTIIIPTLSNSQGLFKLVSVLARTPYSVVIVDNNPSEEKKKLTDGGLIYLPQSNNLGFASAINRGAHDIKTEWLLILNDDIEFTEPVTLLSQLITYARKNQAIAVSPILVDNQGRVENYGYRVLPFGKVELAKDGKESIDGLTAACLLIKTDVFQKLNGFDESFFAYLEDVDLFLRIKKEYGNRFAVCSEIQVTHLQSITSKKMGTFKQKQDLVNWIRLIVKHPDRFRILPLGNFDPLNFIKLIVERLRNLSGLIKAVVANRR